MNQNSIVWFQNQTPQTDPRITIKKNGKISIGRTAQSLLPDYVQFGFDSRSRLLFLKESADKTGFHVNSVPKKNPLLTIFLSQQNIHFPAVFRIRQSDLEPGLWEGTLMEHTEDYLVKEIQELAKTDLFSARSSDAMETLLELYRPKLQVMCRSLARTIPREDRLQIAQEGFLQAVLQYNPNFHIFQDFVLSATKKYVKQQIAQYKGIYQELYPLERTSPQGKSYEVYSDRKAGEALEAVSGRYDLEQRLTAEEYRLYQKLEEGYQKEELLPLFRLEEEDYLEMLTHIKDALSES